MNSLCVHVDRRMSKKTTVFKSEYERCSTGHHVVKLVVGSYKDNNNLARDKVTHHVIVIMLQYRIHVTY